MPRVKICGLNRMDAVDAAIKAGADYLGLVFCAASPRCVTASEAAALRVLGPRYVGLFVEPTDADLATVLTHVHLDVLQLYAPAPRVREVRARFDIEVWRAVGVAGRDELPADAEGADALVIEARPPQDAARPGGNAAALDWSMLAGWAPPYPWILAGGLRPDNVGQAIAASGAQAVDVSSGVETALGVKSPALICAFVAAARAVASARPPAGV